MVKVILNRMFLAAMLAAASVTMIAPNGARADAPGVSLRPVARPANLAKSANSGATSKVVRVVARPQVSVTSAKGLIAAAKLGGHVGFAVADTKSGLVLETHEGSLGQPPASVTKSVTALYALDQLGAGHRFYTRLMATGTVSNGILKGDLILVGGGDPTLSTNGLADMAKMLKAAGVRTVRGRFLVHHGAVPSIHQIDPGQPDHVGYNPAISGLTLNYNRVHFEWKRGANGYKITMDARTNKYRPDVSMAKMRVVKRTTPVYTYSAKGGIDQWTVAQTALGKGGSRWLPVRQPEIYAGEVFRAMARAQGITMKAAKVATRPPKGTVLVNYKSPELRVILKDMLKYSNNLTAEMVGLSATIKRTGRASTLKASAAEMNRYAAQKLGMRSARLVDHSGLGSASRLSAGGMAAALVRVHKRGVLRPMLKPISMRHDNGKVNKSHPIKVYAKTGTLNFVSALAGYMTGADGTEMAFAIFAADQSKRAKVNRADREKPQGARGWNKRAKRLQQKLIERWGALYGK